MKLGHYQFKNNFGEYRFCIVRDSDLIDFNYTWANFYKTQGYYNYEDRAKILFPSKLSKFLKISTNPLVQLQETVDLAEKLLILGITNHLIKKENTHLGKPLDEISTYRDFYTHEKHVKKGFEKRGEPMPHDWYELPVYYKGSTANFIGPNENIVWPSFTDKLDYELELAAVISKDVFNVAKENVYKNILGFTILNDISARDIQKREMAVRLGPSKGKDFCSIIGPVITTIDEFKFMEPKLKMTCKVNGKLWSQGMSSDAHFSFSDMISFCGKEEWILAGDLMGSGTVGTGCGLELDQWIKPGDEIEMEIEKIGLLKNKVMDKTKE